MVQRTFSIWNFGWPSCVKSLECQSPSLSAWWPPWRHPPEAALLSTAPTHEIKTARERAKQQTCPEGIPDMNNKLTIAYTICCLISYVSMTLKVMRLALCTKSNENA